MRIKNRANTIVWENTHNLVSNFNIVRVLQVQSFYILMKKYKKKIHKKLFLFELVLFHFEQVFFIYKIKT